MSAVRRFWERLPVGQRPVRVLAFVSGGPDSMALASLLDGLRAEFSFRLELAHLNYGLRPEADAETALVEKWAKERGLTCRVRREPLAGTQGNLQARARAARWAVARAWLAGGPDPEHKAGAAAFMPAAVALGHNADDQVETMLLHLLRGSGLAGMGGMHAVANLAGMIVLRPLLLLPRVVIGEYLAARGVPFAEDSSNAKDEYSRNRLRHQFPVMAAKINTAYHEHFQQVAEAAGEADGLLRERATNMVARGRTAAFISIDSATLKGYHRIERFYWWQAALAELSAAITTARFQALERFLATGAARWQETGVAAEQWRKRIFVYAPARLAVPAPVTVSLQGSARAADWGLALDGRELAAWPEILPPGAALLDAEALRGPFMIRGRQAGDRFKPAGLGGHTQKLKEFLPACNIPRFLRDRIPLLVDAGRDGAIIWVVGQRVAEDVAARRDSRQLRLVTMREGA